MKLACRSEPGIFPIKYFLALMAELLNDCIINTQGGIYKIIFKETKEIYNLPIFLINDPIKYEENDDSAKNPPEIINVFFKRIRRRI